MSTAPRGPGASSVQWFADAAAFDRLAPLLWDPVSRAAVAAARLLPGQRVLDLCCGTGASALPAARAVGRDGRVEAVDLAEDLLGALRRRAAEEDLPQLVTSLSDATADGPPEHDVLLWVLGLFFLDDPVAGGRAAVGRVRPGGTVVVSTWATGALATVLGPLAEAGRAGARSAPEPESDQGPPTSAAISAPEWLSTEEGLREWAGEVGLVDTRVRRAPHRLVVTTQVVRDMLRGTVGGAMVAGADPAAVDRAVAAAVAGGDADATTLVLTARRPA